jgi:hypothetical protein
VELNHTACQLLEYEEGVTSDACGGEEKCM